MEESKEIKALLHLIDDPDDEVYHSVTEKIFSYGKEIIPNLESYWERVENTAVQERLEMLIHKLHFRDLQENFETWKSAPESLLQGAILVAKYQYPELDENSVRAEIEKMRRNIWLELNNYLTPLEQINVFNSIFFNYYKHKGIELSYTNPDHFLVQKTLENKKGNAFSNGIIYLSIAAMLDIPVKAVNIPRQFLIAYFDEQYELLNPKGKSADAIKFYIDSLNGQLYSQRDVEMYLKKLAAEPKKAFFKPMSNIQIIAYLLEEFSKCFDDESSLFKQNELLSIATMLKN